MNMRTVIPLYWIILTPFPSVNFHEKQKTTNNLDLENLGPTILNLLSPHHNTHIKFFTAGTSSHFLHEDTYSTFNLMNFNNKSILL